MYTIKTLVRGKLLWRSIPKWMKSGDSDVWKLRAKFVQYFSPIRSWSETRVQSTLTKGRRESSMPNIVHTTNNFLSNYSQARKLFPLVFSRSLLVIIIKRQLTVFLDPFCVIDNPQTQLRTKRTNFEWNLRYPKIKESRDGRIILFISIAY